MGARNQIIIKGFLTTERVENEKEPAQTGRAAGGNDDDSEDVDFEELVDIIEEEAEKADNAVNTKKKKQF